MHPLGKTAFISACLVGALAGLGAFTFRYAEGLSYFSTDPRACQVCHPYAEEEITARVATIQNRTHDLMEREASAMVDMLDAIDAAKKAGAGDDRLAPVLELQRKAQWRLDFIAAENSMGFHAPAEAARILGESIDYSRQAQVGANEIGRGGGAGTR